MRGIIAKYLLLYKLRYSILLDLLTCDNEMKLGEHKIAIICENI